MVRFLTPTAVAALCLGTAFADPCEGKLPTTAGASFSGTVRYVVDGDGFCVGKSDDPSTWIEVRLLDFSAPEIGTAKGRAAKAVLTDKVMGKAVSCSVGKGRGGKTTSFDRVHATCVVGNVSVATILRREGVEQGGK